MPFFLFPSPEVSLGSIEVQHFSHRATRKPLSDHRRYWCQKCSEKMFILLLGEGYRSNHLLQSLPLVDRLCSSPIEKVRITTEDNQELPPGGAYGMQTAITHSDNTACESLRD